MKFLFVLFGSVAFATAIPGQVLQFVTKTAFLTERWNGIAVDIDGDGIEELLGGGNILSSQTGQIFNILRINGNGDWALENFGSQSLPGPFIPPTAGILTRALAVGDANGDGLLDVFVSRKGGLFTGSQLMTDLLFVQDAQGDFVDASALLPTRTTLLSGWHGKSACFADLDADGDQDLVLCDSSGLLLYFNEQGQFVDRTAQKIVGLAPGGASRVVAFDVDLDGDLDLFATFHNQPMLVFENLGGAATFAMVPQLYSGQGSGLWLFDANHDGLDDVLVGAQGLLLSQPGSTTMASGLHLLPSAPGMVFQPESQVGDFNRDGRVDIMGWHAQQQVHRYAYWENTSTGFIDRSADVMGLPMLLASAGFVIDWDLDGDLDVASGWGWYGQVVLSNTYREARTWIPPTVGGVFGVDFYSQPQHAMIVLLGSREVNIPIPGFGRAYVDPAEMLVLTSLYFPVRDKQRVTLPIPNVPALFGMRLAMQGVDFDLLTGEIQTTSTAANYIQ